MKVKRLACLYGLALLIAGSAQASDVITGTSVSEAALKWGNGNKMEVDSLNHLHAVYSDGYQVYYVTSADGDIWDPPGPVALSTGEYSANHAAIAVHGAKMAAVWWEDDDTPQGRIVYAHRTLPNAWSAPITLVNQGQEPAIALRGMIAHIVWKTHTPGSDSSVQYRTIDPFSAPPVFPWNFGEPVQQTFCPGTYYTKPSIALVRKLCYPDIPKVAYLEVSDEQAGGPCASPTTRIGPRVESRNAGIWTQEAEYISTTIDPDVDPVSLSLSSQYKKGVLYLAWSDQRTNETRTALAHGKTSWQLLPNLELERSHVHIRANNLNWAANGQFRLVYSDEIAFSSAKTRTGIGLDGIPVTLSGAATIGDTSQPDRLPQAQWWRRFIGGGMATLSHYFEEETLHPLNPPVLVTDYFWSMLYPLPGPIVHETACANRKITFAGLQVNGSEGTAVDLTEIGVVTKITDTGATITTPDRKTITATWSNGRLAGWDDESFTLTAPRGALRFTSRDVTFEIEDLGYIKDYDGVK